MESIEVKYITKKVTHSFFPSLRSCLAISLSFCSWMFICTRKLSPQLSHLSHGCFQIVVLPWLGISSACLAAVLVTI